MRTIFIASVFAALAHAGCLTVSSDRIMARDLSDAVPFLQELDPDTSLGFSLDRARNGFFRPETSRLSPSATA